MRKFFLLLMALPFIGGCCACRKGSPVIGNLENTVWMLKEISGNQPSSVIKVTFDAGSKMMRGKSDSGEVFSGYHLYEKENGNIEFLQPGYNGTDMDIKTLSELLPLTVTVKIDGGHLLFIDSSLELVAVFAQ